MHIQQALREFENEAAEERVQISRELPEDKFPLLHALSREAVIREYPHPCSADREEICSGEYGSRIVVPDAWLAYSTVRQVNFSNEVTLYKQAAADPRCDL